MPVAIAWAFTSKPVFNVEQELCFCSESLLAVANKTPQELTSVLKTFLPRAKLIRQGLQQHDHMLVHKRRIISADEKQMGDEVHENKEYINNVTRRETPSKVHHHRNRIPLRLLASIYNRYHNITSTVLFAVLIICCITCQVLKNLFHGISWFCLRVFKATHT
jgi:hypothetical protein